MSPCPPSNPIPKAFGETEDRCGCMVEVHAYVLYSCINIYRGLCVHISVCVCIYLYIYMLMHVCVCMYVGMYIYFGNKSALQKLVQGFVSSRGPIAQMCSARGLSLPWECVQQPTVGTYMGLSTLGCAHWTNFGSSLKKPHWHNHRKAASPPLASQFFPWSPPRLVKTIYAMYILHVRGI